MNNLDITGTCCNKSKFYLLHLRSNLLYFVLKIKDIFMYARKTKFKCSLGNSFLSVCFVHECSIHQIFCAAFLLYSCKIKELFTLFSGKTYILSDACLKCLE